MATLEAMKLLVLGGTEFVGRNLVEAALALGHEVTIFNRGRRNPDLFAQSERLIGDRRGDLSILFGRQWDSVIDTSGYLPGEVKNSAEVLRRSVHQYVFISTISVYSDFATNTSETGPLEEISESDVAVAENLHPPHRTLPGGGYGDAYGGLKALCEREVRSAMNGRALIVRPGFLIGPYDYSGRYAYWVDVLGRKKVVLAPGSPDRQVRILDVRDLCNWILRMIEAQRDGTFNATGVDDMTMLKLLDQTRKGIGSRAELVWIPEGRLFTEGEKPVETLPFWLPPQHHSVFQVRNDRAVANGLSFRPLSESSKAVQEWLCYDETARIAPGLPHDLEAELLNNK
jgi:2'-hydroxyisoflavone reductase